MLSVSAVLANSFGGQLLSGERVTTDFTASLEEQPKTVDGSDEPVADAADEEPERRTVTFNVDLHCGGCADRAKAAVDQDGVSVIAADPSTQKVEVEYNPHVINAVTLGTAIRNLGYTVKRDDPPV